MKRRISAAMMVSGTILLLISMVFTTVSFAAPDLARDKSALSVAGMAQPGQCAPQSCDDGNPCTYDDSQEGTWVDDHCRDLGPGGIECTNQGLCEMAADASKNSCGSEWIEGHCEWGACAGTSYSCDDGDVCTDDACDGNGGCTYTNNTSDCDDGDACTENDVCSGGECAGTDKDCSALDDQCVVGTCNAASGDCEPLNRPNGTPCDDDDPLTQNDVCTDGVCAGEPPAGCQTDDDCPDDANVCTDPVCQDGTCGFENNTDPCDDGDACTIGDVCSGGACAGTDKDCSALDGQCTEGVCDPGTGDCVAQPANEGGSCDDGDICTEPDVCTAGDCSGSQLAPRPCYTGDAATRNVGVCQDGTETCSNNSWGECVGEVTPGTEVCDAAMLDEDCDGSQNEDCACEEGDTMPCGTDEGECVAGTQTCDSTGTWGECVGAVGPSEEICDGLDNDCDGSVDEGLGTTTCGVGECEETVDNCVAGEPQECVPGEPTAEICDDKDNDCDGKIDEGGVCGAPPPEGPPEAAPTPTPTPVVEVLGVEELPTAGIMPVGPALPILPMIFSSLALIGGGLLLWGDEDE
jgi:hypothetical protein